MAWPGPGLVWSLKLPGSGPSWGPPQDLLAPDLEWSPGLPSCTEVTRYPGLCHGEVNSVAKVLGCKQGDGADQRNERERGRGTADPLGSFLEEVGFQQTWPRQQWEKK